MIKRKTKINTALLSSLIISSVILGTMVTTQTTAQNNYNAKKQELFYSSEVELNSASKYSPRVLEKKEKYKKAINKKLGDRLDNFDNKKLIIISKKIENLLSKIEKNDYLSTEKQEKIISQYLALKEIIDKQIEKNKEVSIDINIDEILKI